LPLVALVRAEARTREQFCTGFEPRAAALVAAFLGGLVVGIATHKPAAAAPQPVAQTIHLVGTGANGASGTATIRSTAGGKAIELTVRGLPAPPPGSF
jgi:hypothetical protein